ncbi:hypothetical protein, partial [Allofournierella massiliensis]|uniref:hypothetical protein n=1 Tax=Allofournierella massiliensis TaxID=1650663 RepID=UPI003FEDE5AB
PRKGAARFFAGKNLSIGLTSRANCDKIRRFKMTRRQGGGSMNKMICKQSVFVLASVFFLLVQGVFV